MPERIPAEAEISVVIARSIAALTSATDLTAPFVAVLPDDNTWDDYGRNYFSTVHVRLGPNKSRTMHMRMMFEGFNLTREALRSFLGERRVDILKIETIGTSFVSLFPSTDSYRELIADLGFDKGVSALRALHDAIVAQTEKDNEETLKLIDTEAFHLGVMRASGAYDALRRGGRYFRENMPTPTKEAAQSFIFSAKLKHAINRYRIRFSFNRDDLFRDRISILVGRNGAGKTQLLNAIVESLTEGVSKDTGSARIRPHIHPSRVLVFSSVPTDPFPKSIGAWSGIDYEYFPVNATSERGTVSLLSTLLACKQEGSKPLAETGKSRLDIVRDALTAIKLWRTLYIPIRLARDQARHHSEVEVAGQHYFPVHQRLSEIDSLRLYRRVDWDKEVVALNDDMEVRRLSSGEHAMLRFAVQASGAIEQGSLLLLDEPETHLHPNFVSDLIAILDSLLQSTGSIAIIATHSSYVVREVPRQRVNILTIKDGEISVDRPRVQTFGANIDTISQFIFDDFSFSHVHQRTLENWADSTGRTMGIDAIVRRFSGELNPESLSFIASYLRRNDVQG